MPDKLTDAENAVILDEVVALFDQAKDKLQSVMKQWEPCSTRHKYLRMAQHSYKELGTACGWLVMLRRELRKAISADEAERDNG